MLCTDFERNTTHMLSRVQCTHVVDSGTVLSVGHSGQVSTQRVRSPWADQTTAKHHRYTMHDACHTSSLGVRPNSECVSKASAS